MSLVFALGLLVVIVAILLGNGTRMQPKPLDTALAEIEQNKIEIARLNSENTSLRSQVSKLEAEGKLFYFYEKNKSEISELIEEKFSQSIAAGLNASDLKT